MTTAIKTPRADQPVKYDPLTGEIVEVPEWVGKRRQRAETEPAPCLLFQWPQDRKLRYDLFDTWHDVAMEVIHHNNPKASFRLMAVARKVFRWSLLGIVDTDDQLAARSGRCSAKVIGREVRTARDLGIIISELGWRKDNGDFRKTRIIRLAVPLTLPPGISLPDDTFHHVDAHGPNGSTDHMDAHGPDDMDAHGPFTLDHKKGGRDGAA